VFDSVDDVIAFSQKHDKEPLSSDNVDHALELLRMDIIQSLDQISVGVTNEAFVKELDLLFFRLLNLGYCESKK
jgi:hypothetical protein